MNAGVRATNRLVILQFDVSAPPHQDVPVAQQVVGHLCWSRATGPGHQQLLEGSRRELILLELCDDVFKEFHLHMFILLESFVFKIHA